MWLADKTVKQLMDSVEADNGNAYRAELERIMPKISDAYRQDDKPFRNHLGASMIGRECNRELWYSYRWAVKKKFSGRLQLLFNRGHMEEARFLALLISAGIEVWYETDEGGQFVVSYLNGHFGSAIDGIVRGIQELPEGTAAGVEFKTSSEKIFLKIKANGVRNEKPEHFAQTQIYMTAFDLKYCLYLIVNKNTDEIHGEIIASVSDQTPFYIKKAGRIIFSDEAPVKINTSPSWWKCRFCDSKDVCHNHAVPEVNCRTCAHFSAEEDGTWSCAIEGEALHTADKYIGCDDHVFNPHILSQHITYLGGADDGRNTNLILLDGTDIVQGPDGMTSKELKERGTL